MFKIFKINKENIETEVQPVQGIYVVYELFEYIFKYEGNIQSDSVFIEDELLDPILISNSKTIVSLSAKKRLFEDYFGYLTITINNLKYNFEVRIQKLKVPELEDILLYLWNQDPILFDNFFSKSTLKSKLSKENNSFDYSSKFVNIFDDFFNFFKQRYFIFKSLPHSVLRTKSVIREYENSDISSNSIDWLVNNLDEMHIDFLYKNVENAISLNNNYGLIENILTEEKFSDYNIYENQIVLGAFIYVRHEITKIRDTINNHLVAKKFYEKDFYSIDELKIMPFLKLKDELDKVETKIKSLNKRYQDIFIKTLGKSALPKLTPVFSNKKHYNDAYNKIKLIRDIKLSLEGDLNLLNIKKISTLYERFNLLILINAFLSRNPKNVKNGSLKTEDNINQEFYFQFSNCEAYLYYDYVVSSTINRTGLQRISNGYYRPDYIIKIVTAVGTKHYILDSKYSSESTVKNNHLFKCIKGYILDMAITGEKSSKIDELILLYPGENEEVIYGNSIFNPLISIMPSKIKKNNIVNFLNKIIDNA